MKKTISYAALALILAGSFATSCESNTQRVERAQENLLDANEELKDAQIALDAEYPAFKLDAETKIAANEKRIEELNNEIVRPGNKKLDDLRKQRIEELKLKNTNLRVKLNTYEKEGSDWEVFKREFRHDMNGVLDALKDFGTPNTK
jgi:predicted RNase H-like nuclease (RuvC/YqgF family)